MIVIANAFPKLLTVKIFVRKLSQEQRFRIGVDSQHVKASELLVIFPWDPFSHVLLLFSGKLIRNIFPLVLGEILGMFGNTLTTDGKYPVQGCENLQLPFQMHLLEKRKKFLNFFFFHYWNLHQILNIFKKKMIVIAHVFPKLQTVENLVRPFSKKRRFRTRFDSEHVKASQIVAKSPWESFYHVFHHS